MLISFPPCFSSNFFSGQAAVFVFKMVFKISQELFTNGYNNFFKQTVVAKLYSDFWIIPEIHCLQNQSIEFESFTIYQYNRIVNAKNRRGSGGIAIAIHNSVLETHIVVGVFKGNDGQLGLKLKNNLNDFLLGIIGLLLSPDSYFYGQDP